MKINFNDEKPENIYQVGNLIRNEEDLYIVVDDINGGYALICLSKNDLFGRYDTLEELIEDAKGDGDILVNAEINVF